MDILYNDLLKTRENIGNNIIRRNIGLCGNIECLYRLDLVNKKLARKVLNSLFEGYKGYTNSIDSVEPIKDYKVNYINKTLWVGEQLEQRKELLEYCINKLISNNQENMTLAEYIKTI